MSDKDDLPARGIPFYSLVDELGVSTDGTSASMNTIRSRGMQPICEVNSSGVATSGSTLEELRRRGIRFYCAVTENAVTSDAVSLTTLRSRGIPFLCPVDVDGIAVGGTATITQLAARGMPYVCLLDSLGSAGGSPPAANTLVAGAGSFVLSGETMTPLVDFHLSAAAGSFTLTGLDVTLTGTSFTPASLSPNLWIEPGKGGLFQSNAGTTAATANSDVVGFCPDQSGNTFTLTSAADDTTRPTLQGVGTFPYLSFDGSNDMLRRTAALGSYAAGACSIFVVIRSNSPTVGARVFAEGDSASTNSVYSIVETNSTTSTSASGLIRNSTNTTLLGSSTVLQTGVFNGSDHVYGVIDDGANVTPYLDGVAGSAVPYTRGGTLTQDRTALGGLLRTSASSFWAGRVYGLVVVNRAITTQERTDLTTYLGSLAGLSL